MKEVNLHAVEWVGAMSLEETDAGLRPWRLPVEWLDFLHERTRFQAGNPSGVRLRFSSSAGLVVLRVNPERETRWFDLMSDGRPSGRVALEAGGTEVAFHGLAAGTKVLELWLNHMYAPVVVQSLSVDDNASLEPAPPPGMPRILFHGSSISHGRKAAGPTESWPVGAARLAGLDPLNLGVGGACRLEPAVARVIRGLPADYLSFCFGVNVVAARTHDVGAFRAGVVGFIQIVREGHPDTPLAVQGPIFCRKLEDTEPAGSLSLRRCREILREVVECFRGHGDRKMMYGGDLEMFGEPDERMLFDGVHPDAEGHPIMSRRYAEQVWPRLRAL